MPINEINELTELLDLLTQCFIIQTLRRNPKEAYYKALAQLLYAMPVQFLLLRSN